MTRHVREATLVVADKAQEIFDLPGFTVCGQSDHQIMALNLEDLIPLPKGSQLFFLPDRHPIAYDANTQTYEVLRDHGAVAAFIPPGYTQTWTAAYVENSSAKLLPLYSYAPVACYRGAFYVPALKVDTRKVHDISCLDHTALDRGLEVYHGTANRLIRHLAHCAKTNFCPNAINFFMGRHECPLPTSPHCNARCLGCISFQPKGSCPSTQKRLTFAPTAEEVAEIALMHIKVARKPIVSFGQGCEGEPLLASKVICQAIRIIRAETSRGIIHMNTNASLNGAMGDVCAAGIDSIRVSMNSAQEEFYHRYYAPRGYTFADVCRSIAIAKRHKKFVALNYLVMPGFTDRASEYKAMVKLIRTYKVDMIQWRNLNYDPQRYFKHMQVDPREKFLGVGTVMRRLREQFPRLRHGYFNVEDIS
ncbi:MAG: radical SAM protein [Candidatus Omnitrophota bacterium]